MLQENNQQDMIRDSIRMEIKRFAPLDYRTNEAINTLCTNLSFTGGDIKKILMTSCRPHEGKSFVTMNLMRSLAGLGMKVVLVDADIRASVLQGSYDIRVNMPEGQKYKGLTRYLAGRCTMDEILLPTNIPNASMILAGHNVANSLPLLNTPRLGQLLDDLAQRFDIVLVDAPPVGTIIDAAKIAENCDGALFVVQCGLVSYMELRSAMQQMEKAKVPILGTVLNKYDDHKYGDRYYYNDKGYYSHYGSEHGERSKKKKSGSSSKKSSRTSGEAGRASKA